MNKNSMTELRNKIVRYFSITTFSIAVVESAIDSTWNDLIYPAVYSNIDKPPVTDPPVLIYIAVSIMMYFIGGIIFYKLTKNAIQKETSRQIKEQNMLYATIAHDLKTPMTSIQGFAKALSDGKISPDEQQEIYDIIYKKCKSMDSLINTMSEYAKFGSGCYEQKSEKINLSALLREVIAELYCDFEEHDIELDIDIPDSEIIINGDESELKRALTNLAVNIYKHNENGIRSKISLYTKADSAVIVFSDSGNCIPDTMHIFEPFVTENTARTSGGGTGLGLAIVKRIIELHGGNITLSHDVSDYTKEFIVTLNIIK